MFDGPDKSNGFFSEIREFQMQDMVNFSLLGCAIVASLAFAMLSAYGICRSAFAVLRIHASSVAENKLEKVSAAS